TSARVRPLTMATRPSKRAATAFSTAVRRGCGTTASGVSASGASTPSRSRNRAGRRMREGGGGRCGKASTAAAAASTVGCDVPMAHPNAELAIGLTPSVAFFAAPRRDAVRPERIVPAARMGQFPVMTETRPALSAEPAAMIDRAREVVRLNVAALQALEAGIGDELVRAVEIILSRPGYVVVTGMGKSGHIGGK